MSSFPCVADMLAIGELHRGQVVDAGHGWTAEMMAAPGLFVAVIDSLPDALLAELVEHKRYAWVMHPQTFRSSMKHCQIGSAPFPLWPQAVGLRLSHSTPGEVLLVRQDPGEEPEVVRALIASQEESGGPR